MLTIICTERGGPAIEGPNGAEGNGSKLVLRSVTGQLTGSINYDWSSEGVIVILKMCVEQLAN